MPKRANDGMARSMRSSVSVASGNPWRPTNSNSRIMSPGSDSRPCGDFRNTEPCSTEKSEFENFDVRSRNAENSELRLD